ncbi:ABC transporter permease [Paenibacillus sp. MWE-103]|uniref:ABC transporter permease n=1 Tax=Paenibacillus artemisiicola TaxID=1172618 RepID=A0ABS3W973_9BACL|nr:ABC transporter permease [Paenibacillus artemisiicola]MBO7744823.1 ABC transporter permease [Paenibacillus artemisiicola]
MRNELWFLVAWTLRHILRNRSNWLIHFGLPIGGVILATVVYGSSSQPDVRVGIVNGDGQAKIAADTIGFMRKLDHMTITMVTEAELKDQLAAGKLDSGLVLSKGFSDSVIAGQPDHIALQSVKGATVTAYYKSMLTGYIDNVGAMARIANGDAAKFDRLYEDYAASTFKVTAQSVNDTSGAKQVSTQSIGFLLMFMLTSAGNLTELILRNRENRTYFRIVSSPISARTYVLSNIVVNLIVMAAQIAVALFFMRAVFHLSVGVPFGEMFGLLVLYALIAVSLSLAVVAFSKSSSAASALQNLIFTPTSMLAGCFFPIAIMPDAVRRVADFLPQRWLLDAIDKLQSGSGIGALGLHFAVLTAFAAVFFLIAVYKFGRSNDTRNFV